MLRETYTRLWQILHRFEWYKYKMNISKIAVLRLQFAPASHKIIRIFSQIYDFNLTITFLENMVERKNVPYGIALTIPSN